MSLLHRRCQEKEEAMSFKSFLSHQRPDFESRALKAPLAQTLRDSDDNLNPSPVSPLPLPFPAHLLTVQSVFAPDISHGWKAAGTRLGGGWDAAGTRLGRAELWRGGRGVGARSGCCDLRKLCSTERERVLNGASKTRSIALARPPALLLPGGPDMCPFFLPNSQWFNFYDVTEPGTGARRLGFIFLCWQLINEV